MEKKPYELHEVAYQQIKERGLKTWNQIKSSSTDEEIDFNSVSFLERVLHQPWAPKGGLALDIGCGTGPFSRVLNKMGFSTVGIDISKTAVELAREQSQGLNAVYYVDDICNSKLEEKFHLAVDSHCLHCIITDEDRSGFFRSIKDRLKPEGVMLISTMCLPCDDKIFNETCKGQILQDKIIFSPFENSEEYQGAKTIKGKKYVPTRFVNTLEGTLEEVKKAGFNILTYIFQHHNEDSPMCFVDIAAVSNSED